MNANAVSGVVPATRSGDADVWRLSTAQALGGANSAIVYSTGAIVGNMLAPSNALATLPVRALARRHGRRAAFLTGTGSGVLVGLQASLAVLWSSFWLFCLAMFFGGAYAAVVLSCSASRPPIAFRPHVARALCRP
jgi:hypothetical protein